MQRTEVYSIVSESCYSGKAPGIYHLHIKEARADISNYIHNYNFERCHSAIGNVTLASVYYPTMLYEAARDVA